MKGPLGTFAAFVLVLLAAAPLASGEEQTREAYKAQIEPICEANRSANEEIMEGARKRINRDELAPAGKQFTQVSASFGGLIKRLITVPAPPADQHRVERWFEQMRLLKTRLRNVGKYYKEGKEIKATHESILAERSGISANNISIVFKVRYCRFGRIKGS
jgi:phage host-nuclease inhibitor protein Gam